MLRDGTGWAPYYAPYRRGAEIRPIRSHGKGVIWGYGRGGVAGWVRASLGDAYSNELRLMRAWLDRDGGASGGVSLAGALWVGDKLYGRAAQLWGRVLRWVAWGACSAEFASAGAGEVALACVGAFRGVGLGVGGALSDRAGVWEHPACGWE